MTDWHCHLLPGIDDGPDTLEEALEMANFLSQSGYKTIYCTPHMVKGSFEAGNAVVLSVLHALQKEINQKKIRIRVLPGREYYLDEFFPDYMKDPLSLGETRFLLVEIPNFIPKLFVREACFMIKRRGYFPMIAHPERCVHFAEPDLKKINFFTKKWNALRGKSWRQTSKCSEENSSLLSYLQNIGCLFQGNLGSFTGLYGNGVRRSAEQLKRLKVYTHWGTDLHTVPADNAAYLAETMASFDTGRIRG